MTTVLNHGRLFQLKFFNRLSIKSVTIYRPNESKIYVFNGNGNNSIWENDGLLDYGTCWPNFDQNYRIDVTITVISNNIQVKNLLGIQCVYIDAAL